MTYVGLIVGVTKGKEFSFQGSLFGKRVDSKLAKILDTSIIIDGRVADIVETGCLEGQLMVPEFVLRELQMVVDSARADSVKRSRVVVEVWISSRRFKRNPMSTCILSSGTMLKSEKLT